MNPVRLSRSILVLAATATGSLATTSAYAKDYVPEKVIYRLIHPDARIKIITSHRGKYGPGCPENHICAVRAAANADIESVEIDVKESSNGTLWPFHDNTVGRLTNYTYRGRPFDPFAAGGGTPLANPAVSSLTDQQLGQLKLRDNDGRVTGYWAGDLRTLLGVIKTTVPNMTVILDIKTPSAVRTAATLVNDLRIQDRVVLKFGIGLFTPQQLNAVTRGAFFAPTVYMGDLDNIYSRNRLGTPAVVVADYLREYRAVAGFTYIELGAKEFRSVGGNWALSGSMAEIAWLLRLRAISLGNFAPVIEKLPDARSARTGYYRSDGSCCASLSEYYTRTISFGTETRDDRPNLEAQVRFFNNILTDNADGAMTFARRIGARADEYKITR